MFSKNSYLKSKLRTAAIMLLSVIMALSLFFAAACSDDDDETEKTTSSNDNQTILNGNFEYFSDSDDETYIIYTPNNWSSSTSGNTNYVMNGIVDTSENGWAKLAADDLADTLDYNNSLDEDDDDYEDEYVDYNGMKSRDIPYKDTYNSLNGDDYYVVHTGTNDSGTYYYIIDNDTEIEVIPTTEEGVYTLDTDTTVSYYDKVLVDNPGTHNDIKTDVPTGADYDAYYVADSTDTRIDDKDCTVTIGSETCIKLYADEDGNYFYDSEFEDPYESHVLMIHNYVNDDTRYGTAQSYSSSTTVTLQPNTAAELSVWVKTNELIYDRNGSEIYEGRGAYIELEQTVGGTSVDSLYIENIRTDGVTENNGWVKYTMYVRGCDFAETTITMTVGLGQAESSSEYSETCEGYAFFDDVKCTVYSSIDKTSMDSVTDAGNNVNECMLTDDEEAKIFSIDSFTDRVLDADSSYYYLDLVSHADQELIELNSGTTTTTVDYTRDSDYYITASEATANSGITGYNLTSTNKYQTGTAYKVNYLTNSIRTDYDVLGIYDLSKLTSDISTAATSLGGGYSYYSNTINSVLGSYYADDYEFDANTDYSALMMLSAYGSAYTTTIQNTTDFKVTSGEYKIVSFWIKTSDMADYTAATITLCAYQYDSEGYLLDASGNRTTDYSQAVIDSSLSSSLSVDTTGVTFDAGDDEDIYNGWVQCFFYVENTADYDITFEIHVGFGNTSISDTDASDYKSGYLALTNIQVLNIDDEDIFSLTSSGTYAASFSLTASDANESNYFDSTGTVDLNNIETNVTNPSSYTGVNGGSASIVYTEDVDNSGKDARNSNDYSGLINTDYWQNYLDEYSADTTNEAYAWLKLILDYKGVSVSEALTTLKEMFGTATMQPLLIANIVREYTDAAAGTTAYAMNYGYIAMSSTSVSSDSYEIITVKVYVSAGAVAYVYLTENDGTTNDVMTLNLPKYTFYYDYQGNVLDGEPDYDDDNYKEKDHIVYYIRDDGLYEDSEGKLYANLYNYSRMYYDQKATYYEAGATTATLYEDLDNDTVYYISESEAQKAASGQSAIESPHYLVAYDSDGDYTRVFIYNNEDFDDSAYHYIITETDDDDEETVSYSDAVSCFDASVANVRYNNTDASDSAMYAVVDARYDKYGVLWGSAGSADNVTDTILKNELGYDANGNYVADTWQTVSFYIHTGDTSYDYTLELWSGARETSGVDSAGSLTDEASAAGTFVAFDLSNMTSDEDSYAELLDELTDEIIDAYVRLLVNEEYFTSGNTIKDTDQNLSYYLDLFSEYMLDRYSANNYEDIDELIDAMIAQYRTAAENATTDAEKAEMLSIMQLWQTVGSLRSVQYYTYTLYDDAGYVPFNTETAEDDETGYDYAPGDYEETLVFLSYVTGSTDTDGKYAANYVTFIDYSASDVTVDTNIADDEDEEDEDDDSTFSVWLLVASIALAVVLIFTMVSLLVRDIIKKVRRNKVHVNNRYSGKRKHYIKKLGLTENEEEPDGGSGDGAADASDGASDNKTE